MSSLDILCVLSNLAIKWNWKFIWADTPYFGTTLLSPSFNSKPNFLTFTNYTSAIALLICVLIPNYFTYTYFILTVNKKHIFCYKIVANSNNMLCFLCIPSKIAVVLAQCMFFRAKSRKFNNSLFCQTKLRFICKVDAFPTKIEKYHFVKANYLFSWKLPAFYSILSVKNYTEQN